MGLTHNILIGRTDMVHVSTLYIYTSKGSCDWHNDGWEQGCTRSLHCKIVILVQLKRFLLFFFSIKQAEWWCLWKSKRSNFLFFYHKWLCLYMYVYIYLENISLVKTNIYTDLLIPLIQNLSTQLASSCKTIQLCNKISTKWLV